ncbi:nucleotide-diphospho-sugar transferase [Protomyces lactucae-debilis]|uniref:UDP-N-acetylglucosamine diphosphorylase n=1 Tax=Protomyces lactucae-debilis TaxID=2754530 RepID=A0A1Y2FUS7_PROLT|nr:nucleotide-diphospho-sugar transferase [Protomyces lactucae-debilis]ORY87760.1 nucleotide-diphospho-sugar transferase [Protomyces lactucae-debilis]
MEKIKEQLARVGITKKEASPAVSLPSEDALAEIRKVYDEAGQGHVFQFWEQLDKKQQSGLYDQACLIDPAHSNGIFTEATKSSEEQEEAGALQPLPKDTFTVLKDEGEADIKCWYESGLQLIAQGKVAAIVMAGGQGTRLGSSEPKGCFDIGLPSKKSLFQLQAERIARLRQLARRHAELDALPPLYWYIMTSQPTRGATMAFFQTHNYFGLDPDQVKFFDQGTLPCFDMDGKILLDRQDLIAESPDGNGGLYKALVTGGIVEHAEKHSVEHFHVYCVDNCLIKVADPLFIGWAADKDFQIATKSVEKKDPSESVGLIVAQGSKPSVVEYSEIEESLTKEKDASGSLKYRAANIVQHYFNRTLIEFAAAWSMDLPHHVAKKKIVHVNANGETEKPSSPNGIKLEQFVFDVFDHCSLEKFGCLEVSREDEFSPLKNPSGDDSPASSKRALMQQGARWIRAAGGVTEDDGSENGAIGVEVSPLISYAGEGLSAHVEGERLLGQAYLERQKA